MPLFSEDAPAFPRTQEYNLYENPPLVYPKRYSRVSVFRALYLVMVYNHKNLSSTVHMDTGHISLFIGIAE